MGLKLSLRASIVLILSCVIVGATYVGYTQFFNRDENALKIVSIELNKSEIGSNFTVTLKIKNTGKNDIKNATLNFIFIKDNDIIDSKVQSLTLQMNIEETYNANFINAPFESGSTYATIITVYLGDSLLDSKTITKQF
jgi:hypothetical protein